MSEQRREEQEEQMTKTDLIDKVSLKDFVSFGIRSSGFFSKK